MTLDQINAFIDDMYSDDGIEDVRMCSPDRRLGVMVVYHHEAPEVLNEWMGWMEEVDCG